ncbi:hypothetical protein CCACVL1_08423 [Corchorus capsularis]|uniref:Uncharacterized protein n=1 Tax=Corchorus capsularis TaxID=210143 RepID=A0A1R3J0N0_COCAP|nr:hypothetical protein CCACVL1_08423 [Corchorus capsularis]
MKLLRSQATFLLESKAEEPSKGRMVRMNATSGAEWTSLLMTCHHKSTVGGSYFVITASDTTFIKTSPLAFEGFIVALIKKFAENTAGESDGLPTQMVTETEMETETDAGFFWARVVVWFAYLWKRKGTRQSDECFVTCSFLSTL